MTDRLADIIASTALNGIDFVEIANDAQTDLVVHFLNRVAVKGTLAATAPVTITGGESVPAVPVGPIANTDWSLDGDGRPLLHLKTPFPGDFSFYTLSIASPKLDAFYAGARFSFKARCPTDLDCAAECVDCPPPDGPAPAIDYLAKDFASFRQALLDFSAVAYPNWVERSEADLGMMLLELIASAGDDLSYLQDRIAAEATLATATERRSVIRHARLVDYEPRPATSAQVTVQLDVADGVVSVAPGTLLDAPTPDGGRIFFEVGVGMIDPDTGSIDTTPLLVDPRWNRLDSAGAPLLEPYWWDDSERCLTAGSTEMWIKGHGHGLKAGDPQFGTVGTALLIDTSAASPIDPPIREVVHLTAAIEETDALYAIDVTRLKWAPAEALRDDHDLTRTLLAGNLLPATEGRRYTERFAIEPPTGEGRTPPPAVVRAGPERCCETAPIYLHTLTQGRLAWLAPAPNAEAATIAGESDVPIPEIAVAQVPDVAGEPQEPWRWRPRLLDAPPYENAFTVDPVGFIDVGAAAEGAIGQPLWEYDGDAADSVRFGDEVFGQRPALGSQFDVTYRVTTGAAGNVAADTIVGVDPTAATSVLRAANPFAATGGADEEQLDEVRRRAPYAFRAIKLRAVRAEDYDDAAEQLPWVLDAGTSFRWTGSWLTVFTTAQPKGVELAPVAEQVGLIDLLNRRRLAGYEVYTPTPRYIGLDLIMVVCAQAGALRGEVEAALLSELGTGARRDGSPAFFSADQFRFGTPLERSELEIAAQRATGVDGVLGIRYRRRGQIPDFVTMPETVTFADDEIIRVDNDPSEPERGSLRIVVKGGK
jgi:hypothetical protein